MATAYPYSYSLLEVVKRLGQDRRGDRYRRSYVQKLVDEADFPPPFPVLVAGALVGTVRSNSRWDAAAVDRWFEDRLPPDTAATIDRAAMREAADTLDARASQLGLVVHQGGRS